jgi:hypothetical protein
MDADREVLTHGHGGRGAVLFPGGRCDFAELADTRGSTFIDGDLVVDGWVENDGGLVFVRGNLITHALFNSGYLIVAGELRTNWFLGESERYGTFVFGDALVTSAAFSRNHHFDVWGECTVGEEIADESDGGASLRQRLHAWGALADAEKTDYLDDAREGLRTLSKGRGPLPEEWASRRWTPRTAPVEATPVGEATPVVEAAPVEAAPVEAGPPPPRAAVLVELEGWLETCGLPQRQQLAVLRSDWVPRIGPDERAEAKRLIRHAVNSKKLASERDELLRALD